MHIHVLAIRASAWQIEIENPQDNPESEVGMHPTGSSAVKNNNSAKSASHGKGEEQYVRIQ
jgi:hypothetical protein